MKCNKITEYMIKYYIPDDDQNQDSPLFTKIEIETEVTSANDCCQTGADNCDTALLDACSSESEEGVESFIWDKNSITCNKITPSEVSYFLPSDDDKSDAIKINKDAEIITADRTECCTASKDGDDIDMTLS